LAQDETGGGRSAPTTSTAGSLGRVADEPLTCAECGREPGEDENAADKWRAYPDISDEMPVFCRNAPPTSSAAD